MGDREESIERIRKELESEIEGCVASSDEGMPEKEPCVRLLSICEAADRLGVCEATIRRYIKSGLIRAYQPVAPKGRIFVPEESLKELFGGS